MKTLTAGFIAVVGRPNVGKSTLVNHLVGFKLSSTSRRPQTTRHQILGIKTSQTHQIVFVDTPGIHQRRDASALFRSLNRAATAALNDVNAIVFVCEALRWTDEDTQVLNIISRMNLPVIAVVNKIDKVPERERLLPYLQQLNERFAFATIVPVAAERGTNTDRLETVLAGYLPEVDEFPYAETQRSLQSHRFYAAEMIREKVMRQLGDELPYSSTVEIETFDITEKLVKVNAVIWVERDGQKAIVIGKGGQRLKLIGSQARLDMENRFDMQVCVKLWVKVRTGWANDERALRSFGYIE